jgi:signal transduction histidine kinase
MKRPWQVALVFLVCLAVVLAAMGWVSATALRLTQREIEARNQADLEERVRLALWRMDSSLAPLIAGENGRPYFAYTAFYPVERAYTNMFSPIEFGEVLVPSPLLTDPPQGVLLYFQFGPDGELSSPQIPTGNMRDLAEARYVSTEKIEAATATLQRLRGQVTREMLLAALPEVSAAAVNATSAPSPSPSLLSRNFPAQAEDYSKVGQKGRSRAELSRRAQQYTQRAQELNVQNTISLPVGNVDGTVMTPIWAGDTLLLARRVRVSGDEYLQGCWLDWPAIKADLLGQIADLLPAAELQPVAAPDAAQESRRLAALPAQLLPGEIRPAQAKMDSPILLSLIVAWGGAGLAAVAVAALLVGTVSLSERRGAFVSAVTHELRTPLTAFRLYTDMLTDQPIRDENTRQRYLQTLRHEAGRLQHLVENVLAYARLERGHARTHAERVRFDHLLERVREPLEQRAEQARMALSVEMDESVRTTDVRVDPSAFERILFNLVDNACKYAATAENRVIQLSAVRAGEHVAVRVRDHGPGIARDDLRRLFTPFHKSARDAAHSAPGVGLGLALSRRLARAMGGELELDETANSGACFIITLPTA